MTGIIKNIIGHASLLFKFEISKRKIREVLNRKEEIFLEVGAGGKKGSNGWLTVDVAQNCDIFWDLRRGIPFPNESVSKMYSSHFFEHLTYKEGQKFLDECLRVLRPGGTFSICVPNARIYIEAYVNSALDTEKFIRCKPAYNNTTKIDYVNYTAYMNDHHKYMFDEENLIHILKAKGMKNVHLREFDPSLDRKERDYESIYAVAEK